jgi:hypothetical protein
MDEVLYVYAVTREPVLPDVEGVDGTRRFGDVSIRGVSAVFSRVAAAEFAQEAIDRRSGDLDWLGAIGYRHQAVMSELMKLTDIVPLRAFTLFSSDDALRGFLNERSEALHAALDRLGGMQEWTLTIEIDPEKWSAGLVSRVAALGQLQTEAKSAAPGKAFLLRKKLDEEKKRAAKSAEGDLVAEVEQLVLEKLRCETVAESRERRAGAFPQINVLVRRDEEAAIQELHAALTARYAEQGAALGLTGPWPPYSFAG